LTFFRNPDCSLSAPIELRFRGLGNGNGDGIKHINGVNGHGSVNGTTTQAPATSNGSSVGDLLAPLNGMVSSLDEATRHTLVSALHEAAENLETPYDTMLRFANAVSYHTTTAAYL